MLGRWYIWT
ncbi:hypothetical protein MTR67_031781 [Solanum verrucosum]|uniref:Uncharacterized protein n=1 Tax=Solanum verrucosum TaxID=315347 RepID=A0AAF0U386_SOLVR|nr:hypothetical protein MTR67_020882 [Solanum verrucosum]WMV38396.1 hypothetical protein MTR67_031781 [Solanum verrucosum]